MNISDFLKLSQMIHNIMSSTVPCHRIEEMAVDDTNFRHFPDVTFETKKKQEETIFVMIVNKLKGPLIVTILVLVATHLISFSIFGYLIFMIYTLKKEKWSIDVELFGMMKELDTNIPTTTENNEHSPNKPSPNKPSPNEPSPNEPSLNEPIPNEHSPSSVSGEKTKPLK